MWTDFTNYCRQHEFRGAAKVCLQQQPSWLFSEWSRHCAMHIQIWRFCNFLDKRCNSSLIGINFGRKLTPRPQTIQNVHDRETSGKKQFRKLFTWIGVSLKTFFQYKNRLKKQSELFCNKTKMNTHFTYLFMAKYKNIALLLVKDGIL